MIERQEVINELKKYFDKIYFDSEAQTEYSRLVYDKYNIMPGIVSSYIIDNSKLDDVTDEDIYRLTSCAKLAIDLSEYFSPQEIKKYSHKPKTESVYPIILENVLPVDVDQYVTTISTRKLFELYDKQIISYNPATQRGPKISSKNGEIKSSPYLNMSSVRSIENLLLRDQFITNDISLNVREEDWDNVLYDPYNMQFEIKAGGVDIIDGYHRYQAVIRVMAENPDFEKYFILNIMKFKEDKAQRFIAQQNKRNKINSAYARALDNTRLDTLVIRSINQNPKSYFYMKFPSFTRVGRGSEAYEEYSFVNTSNAVKESFDLNDNRQVEMVANYLVEALNLYRDAYPLKENEKFTDIDLRIAIIILGDAYKKSETLDYKKITKECYKFKKEYVREGNKLYTRNIIKSLKDRGII